MTRGLFLALPAALLAACTGQPAADNRAAEPALSPAAGPSPGTSAAGGEAGLTAFRADWLEACVGGARDAAPPGTPVERHCGCAIDRMMAGKTLAQLEEEQRSGAYQAPFQAEMRRCIREIPG